MCLSLLRPGFDRVSGRLSLVFLLYASFLLVVFVVSVSAQIIMIKNSGRVLFSHASTFKKVY